MAERSAVMKIAIFGRLPSGIGVICGWEFHLPSGLEFSRYARLNVRVVCSVTWAPVQNAAVGVVVSQVFALEAEHYSGADKLHD